jgi:hypothetical protein
VNLARTLYLQNRVLLVEPLQDLRSFSPATRRTARAYAASLWPSFLFDRFSEKTVSETKPKMTPVELNSGMAVTDTESIVLAE